MCLGKITARKNLKKTTYAWKVVKKTNSGYSGAYIYCGYASLGKGWNSSGRDEWTDDNHLYEAGVHAWARKKDAIADLESFGMPHLRVVKVKLTGPICRGTQEEHPVLVYEKMIIIKEEKVKGYVDFA